MTDYRYLAYGLNIASDFPCAELFPGNDGPVDLHIRLGVVASTLDGGPSPQDSSVCQVRPGKCLFQVAGIARYLVSGAAEIVIDPAIPTDWDAIRLFLLSSPLGAILHLRGIFPLHASGIVSDCGAVLFAGMSGSGKSTIAAAFSRRGFQILADDICAISIAARPMVIPASPYVLLWPDSAREVDLSTDELPRVRADLPKFRLQTNDQFSLEPVRLSRIYLLKTTNGGGPAFSVVHGLRKLEALSLNTYRRTMLDGLGLQKQHFNQVGALAAGVTAVVLERPQLPFEIDPLIDLIIRDFTP